MANVYGYLKPGINEQNIQSILDKLKAAGASKIFLEKPSRTKSNAPQLEKLIAEVQDGDILVVTSLDCIAHNTKHLLEIVESLHASGVTFRVINNGIDTASTQGEVLRMLLGVIVDFERQIVRERQSVGIAKAKREGRYKGRKPTARAKTDEVISLNKQGLTKQKIADVVGIGVASVYRILKDQKLPKISRRKTSKKPEKAPDKKKSVERKLTHETDAEQLSFF